MFTLPRSRDCPDGFVSLNDIVMLVVPLELDTFEFSVLTMPDVRELNMYSYTVTTLIVAFALLAKSEPVVSELDRGDWYGESTVDHGRYD